MKTIRDHVEDGIRTPAELNQALQLAMQLEFATIPPYLCAQWSIYEDPDRVEAILHAIVSQEMTHLAWAGNILGKIGGIPRLANKDFVPMYPLVALPGDIPQPLPIDLRPLTRDQLAVFMQIERPEFGRGSRDIAEGFPTIGDFYDAIITGLRVTSPRIDKCAFCVEVPSAPQIETVADAIRTIEHIKEEGEGFEDSPEEPSADVDRPMFAHYYLFKELYLGRRLVRVGDKWKYAGNEITLPKVRAFEVSKVDTPVLGEFRRALSRLLQDLECCWSVGKSPNVALMFDLAIWGKELIQTGIRPDFIWDGASSRG